MEGKEKMISRTIVTNIQMLYLDSDGVVVEIKNHKQEPFDIKKIDFAAMSRHIDNCIKNKVGIMHDFDDNPKPEDKPTTEKIYTRDDECPFVKGEKILASGINTFAWGAETFYSFDKTLKFPFICVTEGNSHVYSKLYAKKIRPELEVDTKVWVRDHKEDGWEPHHHKGWDSAGHMLCFDNGQTSHSEPDKSCVDWNYYTLEDPNKQ